MSCIRLQVLRCFSSRVHTTWLDSTCTFGPFQSSCVCLSLSCQCVIKPERTFWNKKLLIALVPVSCLSGLPQGSMLSTRGWKHPSEIWVHTDMRASLSCYTSVMRISSSTTSQSCSTGLRSSNWRSHRSLSRSRKLCDMVQHPAGGNIRRWSSVILQGLRWTATYSGRLQHLNLEPKIYQETPILEMVEWKVDQQVLTDSDQPAQHQQPATFKVT